MKSTDKSQITENPWAEGMKGSHDASWLGRLWQGFSGAVVAATQVANAHGEELGKREAAEEQERTPFQYPQDLSVHPSQDPNHPDYYLWNPPEKSSW